MTDSMEVLKAALAPPWCIQYICVVPRTHDTQRFPYSKHLSTLTHPPLNLVIPSSPNILNLDFIYVLESQRLIKASGHFAF